MKVHSPHAFANTSRATLFVTAVHNHVLRRLLRGAEVPEHVLTDAYDRLMHRFGVHPEGEQSRGDDVVVATFPRRMPIAEMARRLRDEL